MTDRKHAVTCWRDCDGWPCKCWCHNGLELTDDDEEQDGGTDGTALGQTRHIDA